MRGRAGGWVGGVERLSCMHACMQWRQTYMHAYNGGRRTCMHASMHTYMEAGGRRRVGREAERQAGRQAGRLKAETEFNQGKTGRYGHGMALLCSQAYRSQVGALEA